MSFFHRHNREDKAHAAAPPQEPQHLQAPEFKFIRSDTHSETVVHPPGGLENQHAYYQQQQYQQQHQYQQQPQQPSSSSSQNGSRNRSASTTQRLRQSLLGHHRHKSDTVPTPNIPDHILKNHTAPGASEKEWEERATMLAKGLTSPTVGASFEGQLMQYQQQQQGQLRPTPAGRSRANSVVSVRPEDDATIQEAIRLHESQKYEEATRMFKALADPRGANNVLSQVLYALSLRHGWGCETDEHLAAEYLKLAASNAADIEDEALKAGMSKGGSAKGELILAIYELANCYRQGWGVPKDLAAAFQYYLTAANLGDTDAMNEVALCYLEGYGTKKNKFEAARYYRLAESKGHKTVGNSWIYKDKYIKYEQNGGKKK